jgi:hypothetical protein
MQKLLCGLLVAALSSIPLLGPLSGGYASASTFNRSKWERISYKDLISFQTTIHELAHASQDNEISLEYTLAGKMKGEGNVISHLAYTPISSLNAELKLLGETIYSLGINVQTLMNDVETNSNPPASTQRMSSQYKTIELLFKEVTGFKL